MSSKTIPADLRQALRKATPEIREWATNLATKGHLVFSITPRQEKLGVSLQDVLDAHYLRQKYSNFNEKQYEEYMYGSARVLVESGRVYLNGSLAQVSSTTIKHGDWIAVLNTD